jgi:TrmH family RNA methyltransferase
MPVPDEKKVIRSAANPLVKRVRAAAAGREDAALLLEGERLVADALRQGIAVELVLLSDDRADEARALERDGHAVRVVARELFARIGTLKTPSGVLALAREPAATPLAALRAESDALVAVAAGVQDPGNLGALARSAEAAGARALVHAGGCSPWSPRALRGSMGSLLRLTLVRQASPAEALRGLAALGFRQVRAATRGGRDHRGFDWRGPLALWVSSETGALPDDVSASPLLEAVSIAMAPGVESLNVTAAAAVLLFAAGRNEARP